MLFFLSKGYRVIAHDRRGHGRSTQTADGHDMDTYAADVAALVSALDLKDAIHVGHSTGGGEATRYVARHGKQNKVAKLVLIGAVPPLMLKTAGQSRRHADRSVRRPSRAARGQPRRLLLDLPDPVLQLQPPGTPLIESIRQNWWRQAMMGGANAHYECVKAFSETDFTEDLKRSIARSSSCTATTIRSSRSPIPRCCHPSSLNAAR